MVGKLPDTYTRLRWLRPGLLDGWLLAGDDKMPLQSDFLINITLREGMRAAWQKHIKLKLRGSSRSLPSVVWRSSAHWELGC